VNDELADDPVDCVEVELKLVVVWLLDVVFVEGADIAPAVVTPTCVLEVTGD